MTRLLKQETDGAWLPKASYLKAIHYIKRSQIILSILIGSTLALLPEIQEQISQKPMRYIFVSLSFEAIIFGIMSWIFGMHRIPANFLSLVFLRFYVFFDCQYRERAEMSPLTARGLYGTASKREATPWFDVWTDKQIATKATCCADGDRPYSTTEKYVFTVLILTMTSLVTIYSKIDVSRCEWLALSLIGVGTLLSTIVLMSSMAIDRMGRDLHFSLCKAWTMVAFVSSIFIFVYATQRLYKRMRGKIPNNERYFRTQAEIMIFAINIFVVVYYIPMIHPGFSFYDVISSFPATVASATPDVARNIAWHLKEDFKALLQTVFYKSTE